MLFIALLITLFITGLCVLGEWLWDKGIESLPIPKIIWIVSESQISTLQRSREIQSANKFVPVLPKASILLR